MIRIIPDNSSGRIIRIEYTNDGFKKVIEPKIPVVTKITDPLNIGTVIETYRKMSSNAEEYLTGKKSVIDDFIERVSILFGNFEPEQIVCFFPADPNRRQILEAFTEKVKSNFKNKNITDHSNNFFKKDASKSIKDGLTKNDYVLQVTQKIDVFKHLLIIDDTIDQGNTLNIYLDKLYEQNLIGAETTIYLACMYNNAKFERVDYLNAARDQQKGK